MCCSVLQCAMRYPRRPRGTSNICHKETCIYEQSPGNETCVPFHASECKQESFHTSDRGGKFSTNLSPSRRIRQVQNTTSCHHSGTMNLNSIRIRAVRGHAPYKYPPRNTMPKSPGTNSNPLRISWSDTSFSPTECRLSDASECGLSRI